MRGHGERTLLVLVILVSVTMTGLTVWAVAQQGRALLNRDLAELRQQAATAAAQRQAAIAADAERACAVIERYRKEGGSDALDTWVAEQRDWLLVVTVETDGAYAVHPRTPLEDPAPVTPDCDAPVQGAAPPEHSPTTSGGRDLLSRLGDFQRTAASSDPLTRAGALLAMAACEQQLGHPLAAARLFADAAQLLRSTQPLSRLAFRAEVARIDALLAAGDRDRAYEVLESFGNTLLAEHGGRLSELETARLAEQASRLGLRATDSAAVVLDELRARARRRAMAVQAVRTVMLDRAAPVLETSRVVFTSGVLPSGERLTSAVRWLAERGGVALAAPTSALLARYWPVGESDTPWRTRLPSRRGDGPEPLLVLGPEFGGAVLELTEARALALSAGARRNLSVVVATALGMAGAWALVIWMLARVVARQRELARLQGRFVADVSHELKTPLALIRLLAETLADARVTDPQRVRAYHETITRESERLTALLDNILDLGRIESGAKKYEFRECDVAEVTRTAWTLFEPQFVAESFDARLDIVGALPRIQADPQALHQVLVNLLQNAYRYAGEGKYVRLKVACEGYLVVFTVEDHGIGMSRAQLRRLGESFFRADDTRVRQTRGAGLGLAIVQHIVTAHGGKVEVQSRPGVGTTFTVWIPFEPQRCAPR